MITKNNISNIKKLHNKKYRDEYQQFIVEGSKSIIDLLSSKIVVKEIFATETWINENSFLRANTIPLTVVTPSELGRISVLKTPQQVLAIAETPIYSLSIFKKNQPILVLDNIRDPGNLGAILRTAEWFGFSQIVCSPETVEFTNPKVIQASMGSFARIKIIYLSLPDFCNEMKNSREIYGTFLNEKAITNANFKNNDILIVGNESTGISEELIPFIDQRISILPSTTSQAESLNVAIATSILLYQYQVSQ